ncbi:MAG: ABC transporter permease [Pseudomonadota bacterium]|nr:ABC transporter permease [Pseudomonadota bacterium]
MRRKPPGYVRTWKDSPLISPLLFVSLIAIWEIAIHVFEVPSIIVPPPSAVAVSLWEGIVTGVFLPHTAATLWEVVAGFISGSIVGIVLGIMIGLSPFLERVLYPYVVAFQAMPKVAIAPIIVIWFGYGIESKIVITAMISFFPVLANTIVGLRAAPQDQVEMLRSATASDWQIFRMVRLPNALPYIFVGLDVAIIVSVIGAIVGEFVGSRVGLGYLIMQRNFNFDMAGVFAILIILAAIGVGLHSLVVIVQRRFLFWSETQSALNSGN